MFITPVSFSASKLWRLIFFTLLGYVYVAIPMVVLTFCYIKVFRKLKQHNKKLQSLRRRGFDQSTAAKITVEDINVTKTLFLTVCAFAICWTPISIVDFIGFAQGSWNLPRQVYVMYTFLGQLSTVVNPIIYGVMNKTFREEYKKLFRWHGNAEITQESEETPQTQESKCSVL